MDPNISLSNLSAFSFLFFPEYLSLGPSEVLVNIHKSHNPERGQLPGSQTHKCYQVSVEDKVVPKYDFPFHQSSLWSYICLVLTTLHMARPQYSYKGLLTLA